MSRKEEAVEMFCDGHLCSQAVLAALCERYDVDRETAIRFGTGFGGGLGCLGRTCGAVTGAVGVLGLALGSIHADDKASRERTFAAVRRFAEAFIARHGSLDCRDLLACDISTPEGHERATEEGLFDRICPDLVGSAVEVLEETLRSAGK